ncbi:hypothetical protein Asi02nite_81420 [Asanoa siamensis]|uniref:DUF397 domain-containing protein n=2 Tax=Asanoa siamensis TaxID=926357 RepID=A0ABQ4D521_9ACTN|nr:hypothetical protein Asi02nite_81420 [Asanoa siamensis]
MTTTTLHEPTSHCHIEATPDGVRITCRRVPLAPGILLTPDQWAHLTSRLTTGRLPDFAIELPGDSWVTKIAPPGQEANALYLWNDELAALTQEIRDGRHPHHNPLPDDHAERPAAVPSGAAAPPSRPGRKAVPGRRTPISAVSGR